MRKILWLVVLGIVSLSSCSKENVRTVNPNATPEARKLLDFLYEIQGKYILSGQHNFIAAGSRYTEQIKESTGKYPIVWGSDFSFCYVGNEPIRFQNSGPLNLDDPGNSTSFETLQSLKVNVTDLTPHEARQNLVETIKARYREGFIITLMWHACPPGYGDCCDGEKIWTMQDRPTQQQWDALMTEGTVLNNAWKVQADTIALYLKQLKDAGVPVLWRPYHEMNGVWFWWGDKKGEDGFKKLWVMLYNYYVHYHKLDNLIWVWDANAPRDIPGDEAYAYEEFWPGSEYVDVLAADIYRDDWKQSHHDDLLKLANGKPIAIGEVAQPPTVRVLESQGDWAWFMSRGNLVLWGNGVDIFEELFKSGRALAKEDVIFEDGTYRVNRK